MREKLIESIGYICELFETDEFMQVLKEFEKYSKDVDKHYKEYIRVNNIWKCIKNNEELLRKLNNGKEEDMLYDKDNGIIATFR